MEQCAYIAARRAKIKGLSREVNLPRGTSLQAVDGVIFCGGAPVCCVTSQNAHDYFARNDDGNGMERGALTAGIIRRLSRRDRDHQERWDRVWADRRCQKYRRPEHEDFWCWNHAFFEASMDDLRHIAALVGATEVTGEKTPRETT